jgi:hypothetical protein
MDQSALEDFAFNTGEWVVAHRRLEERGNGCDRWSEFETRTHSQLLMNGQVSVDETDFGESGFRGMTLRVFDPTRNQWAIYWINSTDGQLQPPVFGRFTDDVGVFEGNDSDRGRPIIVRFEWDTRDKANPRWSQSFSYDDGANWEMNWTMSFKRPEA